MASQPRRPRLELDTLSSQIVLICERPEQAHQPGSQYKYIFNWSTKLSGRWSFGSY